MSSKTLFDKIWDKHVVKHVSEELDMIYIDQHYIHEVTSPQAFEGLRKRGISVFRPERCLATADHNVPTINQLEPIKDKKSAFQVQTLIDNCKEFNIELFGIGHENQGIVHVIGPDLGKTQPGMTIVCGDSHTSTHGAFGTIAFGIGTTQVEQVLATQCLLVKKPKTMKIQLDGPLPRGSSAKDVILFIIAQLGAEGATGFFVEYVGEVFSNMSMEERMTVCNMSIEMGARGGLIGVDEITLDYLESRVAHFDQNRMRWKELISEEDAYFERTVILHSENILPMVTVGTSPDSGLNLNQQVKDSKYVTVQSKKYMGLSDTDKVSAIPVEYVFIGSCTNGRLEDLRSVAKIANGRKKAEGVTVWVVPGSVKVRNQAIEEGLDKIFQQAGFEFREPGCSACLAMNDDKIPSGSICVSTSNRNFEGRQGPGARTILASPETATASAIMGRLTDPRDFLNN